MVIVIFIVAGYNFKSAVNNTAIRHNSIYARCRWLCRRRILRSLASCVENFDSAIVSCGLPPFISRLIDWRYQTIS
jgi:hypothetical protein